MRNSTFIIVFILFQLSSVGQKSISTRELESIADKFGVDSALRIIRPLIDISKIDTAVALSIALKCFNFENYTSQFRFFSEMGQIIRNETINSRAVSNLKSYGNLLYDTTRQKYKRFVIPRQIFHILVFQNDPSIISILKTEFEFWERNADSIINKYPSRLKRFFQRFKGTPPSEQLYSDCKENSFKLAWTLNKFGVNEFSIERANGIQQQLAPYLREYNMDRFKFKHYQSKSDTIELKKSYSAIDEIDFDNEIEFVKVKEDLEGEQCWKQIITNGRLGLYEIGCQWAPLAGEGKVIRLELISQNSLKVTIVLLWIS